MSTQQKYREPIVIINFGRIDHDFLKACEAIFEINAYHDPEDGPMLRKWVETAVKEVASYYSLNPDRMNGSLQEGPYFPNYAKLEDSYSEDQRDRFTMAFRGMALQVFYEFHRKLESQVNKLLADGYEDVYFNVVDYKPGQCAIQLNPMGGDALPMGIVVEPM